MVICYRPHPRDGEGTVFSLFVSSHRSGQGGYRIPGTSPGGGYPIQLMEVPIPGLDGGGGVSHPADGGVPHPRSTSVPPWKGLDGVRLQPESDGVHPPPIRQNSIASTCCTAGGMPLAFTQEDFLVFAEFILLQFA